MKRALIAALAACMLCGCGDRLAFELVGKSDKSSPGFSRYGCDGVYGYFYLVDNRTGVVYLEGFRGITALLNADGTPMTRDGLRLDD